MSLTPPVFEGAGTYNNPYKINSASDLNKLRILVNASTAPYSDLGVFYMQTTHIDLSAYSPWSHIGLNLSHPFKGLYNGNGYKISNITVQPSSLDTGLFGFTGNATLQNIVIESGSITSNRWVGGIVGYAHNTNISGCINKAIITSTGGFAGGIVGYFLRSSGSIYLIDCANFGAVNANGTIAGQKSGGGIAGALAGVAYISVSRLFNAGSITTTQNDVIYAIHGSGASGYLTNSYFDSDTTLAPTQAGATGIVTANCLGENALNTGNLTNLGKIYWKTTAGYPVPINTK